MSSTTITPTDREPRINALLVTAEHAAEMCSVSLRTWRSWLSGGRVPRPVCIGRTLRWRREELNAWIAAGCPSRAKRKSAETSD